MKYRIGKPIGRGSYGTVFKCYKIGDRSNTTYAMKKITGEEFKNINAEVQALRRLQKHPNVVSLIEIYQERPDFCIIMEYCGLGDLTTYIPRNNPDIKKKLDIMLQCASAVRYMHSQDTPIVHRDIKPANILMKTTDKGPVAKITDFGLAKILKIDQKYMQTNVGSVSFCAPELFDTTTKIRYTNKIDNFSLGLVFMVLVNYPKYKGNNIFLNPTPGNHVGFLFTSAFKMFYHDDK